MRAIFFSPLLVILIFTLIAKGLVVLGRLQEETNLNFDNAPNSVIFDTAYAKDDGSNASLSTEEKHSQEAAKNSHSQDSTEHKKKKQY